MKPQSSYPLGGGPPVAESSEPDTAMRNLSQALKVSFRLLRLLMILFAFLYLATGFVSVPAQKQGLVKVFGRLVRVADQGLAYNWPFPIGQIELVDVQVRRLVVDDFWMDETPADKTKSLLQRKRGNKGLRPGWDGSLLTGDQKLIHVRLVCSYQIQQARGASSLGDETRREEILRMVLSRCTLSAAARRTAEAILKTPQDFLAEVSKQTQTQINDLLLSAGGKFDDLRIVSVMPDTEGITWPLGATNAYLAADQAVSERDAAIHTAQARGREMVSVCGQQAFEALAGSPWEDPRGEQKRLDDAFEKNDPKTDRNLIGQLQRANEQGDETRKRQLLRRIEKILQDQSLKGQAGEIIRSAAAENQTQVQQAQSRAERFNKLLKQYLQSPAVFLSEAWSRTLDPILQSASQVNWVLPGKSKIVLRVNTDPKITSELQTIRRRAIKEHK